MNSTNQKNQTIRGGRRHGAQKLHQITVTKFPNSIFEQILGDFTVAFQTTTKTHVQIVSSNSNSIPKGKTLFFSRYITSTVQIRI